MEIKAKWLILEFIILLIALGLTLHNINSFMISEKKCEPAFKIIDKCKCIPDANMAKLFNVKGYIGVTNITRGG